VGGLAAGTVVLVRFPFSDLSNTKLRPAIVLADTGRGDSLLCQVTSRPYGDPRAVELKETDFATGSLELVSFARPGKLFTANEALIAGSVAVLTKEALTRVLDAIVGLLRGGTSSY
jgi:mRNA interferase MazF